MWSIHTKRIDDRLKPLARWAGRAFERVATVALLIVIGGYCALRVSTHDGVTLPVPLMRGLHLVYMEPGLNDLERDRAAIHESAHVADFAAGRAWIKVITRVATTEGEMRAELMAYCAEVTADVAARNDYQKATLDSWEVLWEAHGSPKIDSLAWAARHRAQCGRRISGMKAGFSEPTGDASNTAPVPRHRSRTRRGAVNDP
jgi:hypothetical protein